MKPLVSFILICQNTALLAFNPNSAEVELASLLSTHSGQQRSELIFDEILSEVARDRAEDMGNRNYFSHTNPNGLGPNRLVQLAGYGLPGSWGTANTTNYIESITAALPTARQAFNHMLTSQAHRQHLLGEVGFYAQQTRYGIGYAHVPGSRYNYYYVVITAPPNLTPRVKKSPFEEWKDDHGVDSDISPTSDGDSDGIPLSVEFALGLDPTAVNELTPPSANRNTQCIEWTLPIRDDLGDLTILVHQSTDLTAWSSDGVHRDGNTFSVPLSSRCRFFKIVAEQ